NQEGVLSRISPNEAVVPTETLLNTRRARTRAVHSRKQLYDDALFLPRSQYFRSTEIQSASQLETGFENKAVYNVMLDGNAVFLPLGWHLSKLALSRIEAAKSKETLRSIGLIRRDLMGTDAPDTGATK